MVHGGFNMLGEMTPKKKWTWALFCSMGLLKKNHQLVDVFHFFKPNYQMHFGDAFMP